MVQARHESGKLAADGGWRADDPFTTFLPGGRTALASHQTTKSAAVAVPRFLLLIDCWHLEGDWCVPVCLQPWRWQRRRPCSTPDGQPVKRPVPPPGVFRQGGGMMNLENAR
jgi:hypothetical protein